MFTKVTRYTVGTCGTARGLVQYLYLLLDLLLLTKDKSTCGMLLSR